MWAIVLNEWFNQALPRLRFIIDNMRLSLFRLRRDEKQASLLRNMARYLNQHPEFEISDTLFEDEQLPQTLKLAPVMPLKSYVDTRNSKLESPLVALVQALRKTTKAESILERDSSDLEVSEIQELVIDDDFFEQQTEQLFEQVIKYGEPISAIKYWQKALKSWIIEEQLIDPKQWVELVFSSYCKLTNDQQDALDIKPKGVKVTGTTDNYSYSDVEVLLR